MGEGKIGNISYRNTRSRHGLNVRNIGMTAI